MYPFLGRDLLKERPNREPSEGSAGFPGTLRVIFIALENCQDKLVNPLLAKTLSEIASRQVDP